MMKSIISKKWTKCITAFLLVLILCICSVSMVNAAPNHTLSFTMRNGGSWTYNYKTDTKITGKWTSSQWRSVICVTKVSFYSPDQVRIMLYDFAEDVGIDLSKSALETAVEAAASYGIEKAKDIVKKKFGETVLSKILPFLSAVSWTKTVLDVFDDLASGFMLSTYSKAAKANVGLIHVEARGLGDASEWIWWDGSSEYGSYPTAKLGPNNWQFGNVVIN